MEGKGEDRRKQKGKRQKKGKKYKGKRKREGGRLRFFFLFYHLTMVVGYHKLLSFCLYWIRLYL